MIRAMNRVGTEGPMASAALVIIGIILVVVGILGGGRLEILGLGVLCLIAAGILQVMAMRRT